MPLRVDENVVITGAELVAAVELVNQSYATGSTELYADISRTDTYVEDGSPSRPYKNLLTAITVANTNATSANLYKVVVAPGIYNLAPFTLNPYVKLEGAGWQTTVLKATDLNNHFITMSAASVLTGVCVWGPTLANKAAIVHTDNDTRPAAVLEVSLSRGYYGLLCAPAMSRGVMLVQTLSLAYAGEVFQDFVHIEGFGDMIVETSTCSAPNDKVSRGFSLSGANAKLLAVNCLFEVGGTTDAFFVNNGAVLTMLSCQLNKGLNALRIGTDGVSTLLAHGVAIQNLAGSGFTKDILIESAASTVHFSGSATRGRIDNTVGASLHAQFADVTSGSEGAVTLGENRVGDDPTKLLPLMSYGKAAYLTGLYTGGAVTRNASPSRVLNVALGSGFVNDGTNPVQVTWGNGTVTIAATATEYVYVDKAGVIQHSAVQPVYAENVVLAQVTTNATDVVFLTKDEIEISHSLSKFQEFFEDVIGPLTVSGCLPTVSATPLKVTVGSGSFMVGISTRTVTGGADRPFYYVSQDGAGGWTYTASTVIDTEHYDGGSGPIDYPGVDHFKKDAWYVVVSSGEEIYYCVYGQTPFTDAAAALAGALPTAPTELTHYGLRCGGIISHKSDAALTSIQDVRPFLGQNSPITGAIPVDHDTLLQRNLDNNHPQYLTTTRADTWHGLLPGAHVTNGNTHDHVGGDGAQIDHTGLSNIGTQTHVQLEATLNGHIADTANPHVVTKTQVSLGNVTNDAQLKRAAGDYATFAPKATPVNADVLVIEDSADGGNKKKCTLADLPYPLAAAHGGTHTSAGPDAVPNVVAAGASGLMTGADKTKLDGITALAAVSTVSGTAPIVSSGGTTPAISITAASGAAAGSMSAADFTKLSGIAAGATNNIFGNGYQTAISLARTTYNTNTSFQNKVTLITPALTAGTYRVSWTAVIDGSVTNQNVEAQLYNTTDTAIIGVVQVFRPGNAAERLQVGGFAEVVFAGVAKVFNLQYRTANTLSTVGIADARIEIWRVA